MPTSSAVTEGVNATATQYNNLRTDAIAVVRTYKFEIPGNVIAGDHQGGTHFIEHPNETVVSIKRKIDAGTSATVRIKKDATVVKEGIVASTSLTEETDITSPACVENQVLTLDVTEVSGSPTLLTVTVKTTTTKE